MGRSAHTLIIAINLWNEKLTDPPPFQAIPTVPFSTTSMDIPPNPNFLFKKSLTLPPKTAEICSTPPQIWPKLVKSVHTHQKNGTLDVYGNFP